MRPARTAILGLCTIPSLGGCEGVQSVLHPAGPDAQDIALLAWVLFGGGGAVFALVLLAIGLAILRPATFRGERTTRRLIVGGGVVFPIVTLSALLTWGLLLSGTTARGGAGAPLRIEVTGEQFWWRVHYLDDAGAIVLATANELRLPAGVPIELALKSQDVIHSFWLPSLAGKLDMIPGRVNRLRFSAARPGVYRGQCAEYCGAQHAQMAFFALVEERGAFDRWLAAQRAPAAEPASAVLAEGRRLFAASGCGACHAIRGTAAAGRLGPDLTHVGGRRSIAAGMLPNNVGTLAGWIASAQHLKPGSRMPSFDIFTGPELRAIAAYLESLK
jgi:cytochrome c oxidase subunit 2